MVPPTEYSRSFPLQARAEQVAKPILADLQEVKENLASVSLGLSADQIEGFTLALTFKTTEDVQANRTDEEIELTGVTICPVVRPKPRWWQPSDLYLLEPRGEYSPVAYKLSVASGRIRVAGRSNHLLGIDGQLERTRREHRLYPVSGFGSGTLSPDLTCPSFRHYSQISQANIIKWLILNDRKINLINLKQTNPGLAPVEGICNDLIANRQVQRRYPEQGVYEYLMFFDIVDAKTVSRQAEIDQFQALDSSRTPGYFLDQVGKANQSIFDLFRTVGDLNSEIEIE